ncbi:MAG: LD-carboxypeptidase, partial [Bacteroidota bacterium]|nr:LD-carboxypeptidase [Bacteroidota bacterium]
MHFKYLFCSLLLVSCNLDKPLKMSVKNPQYTPPQKYISPANLQLGDSVAILAPAGLLKGRQQAIESAKNLLKSWGLVPVLGTHLFKKNNHFAGTDAQRFRDFQQALDSPEIKAI